MWQAFLSPTHKWKITFPTIKVSDKNNIHDSNFSHKYRFYSDSEKPNTLKILLK